nr:uncharacterized mitochondrial protein AtMg00810-like [Tanacetum cinerariifolium]
MGELTFFLGLQVKKEDGIFISQDKYVTEVLRKFNFSDVKSANTLVDTKKTLVKDADGADVDVHLYRSMIRSLMYLTASRPDIMCAICASILDSQVEGVLKHKEIYVTPSHTKKIFANMKRHGKDFSGKVTPVFETMMAQPQEDMDEHVTTTSNDPLLSGLGDKEDACKQGRMIDDLDADEGVALVDETQGRNDQDMFDTSILDDEEGRNDQDMFDTSILDDEEVVAEKEVTTVDPVTTVGEVVTIVGVEVSTAAGVEVSTTAGVETSKPKAKGNMMQEPSETPTPTPIDSSQQPSKAKDKVKAKMIEPEKSLKRKD